MAQSGGAPKCSGGPRFAGLVAFSVSASALQRRMDSLAKLDEAGLDSPRVLRVGRSPSSRAAEVRLRFTQVREGLRV